MVTQAVRIDERDECPASVRVRVEPGGWELRVPSQRPLLVGAEWAGVTLPSACRNGTCRACMCRLLAGRIAYRIEWPGLSREEKEAGWILPCVAYPQGDLIIDAPGAAGPDERKELDGPDGRDGSGGAADRR